MKKIIVLLLLLFVVFSCGFSEEKKEKHQQNIISQEGNEYMPLISDTLKVREEKLPLPIDTASLGNFWSNFKKNLKDNNKNEVIEVFNFPIRAIHPVIFKYAHDCDTLAYIQNEEKYIDFDITQDNILQYYDFVFTKELKQVVAQTSLDDLLTKGYGNTVAPSVSYTFFPKEYDIKVNCPNDHNLQFYISYKEDNWSISVGGL
ncbi:hypothetical protein E0W68_12690 [Flavobacterium salilacus subsp. salilacus]|uniref:hypothetical protein n=1 Tax=Flavobacterium TaxID=237 RepID=UPI00107512E2|nr:MULTISPECIES: hypothetical protein [Flavobacterium]KAF2515804.1 hypothetical protein E0W68_12690 [Flavobacterium salilacus subsp. salilacus]MBE1615394.1 hypothetical protein [Flavobacterium sp. SaA2.13]